MSDVTVVCCYNNEKVYNDFVDTLKAQTVPCEIIGIDNRGNRGFTSCSAAYNSVIADVKTKYVVYSHQDILLLEAGCLENFVKCLERTGKNDIAGVAGVKCNAAGIYSDIKQIFKSTGKLAYAGKFRVEGGMMECDTLDECFFGGHTEYFRENPFDEVLCDNWHLYAVEQCLRTKSNHVQGGRVYVCSVNLVHLSDGTLKLGGGKFEVNSPVLYKEFFRLCRKYSADFPEIRTTCIYSKTDFPHALYKYIRKMTKFLLVRFGLFGAIRKSLTKN